MVTVAALQRKYLPFANRQIAPEDFFLLLAHATRKEKVFLLAHPEYELTREEQKKAAQYLKRRLKHEPVAYIVGHKEFYGREFLVTQDTLVPRPETELMIEQVLTLYHVNPHLSQSDLIDLGTGSGNIIITLAKELTKEQRRFFGIDLSEPALFVAMKNAEYHNTKEDITFLRSDLLQNFLLPQEKNRHAVIMANLPYLSSKIYQSSSLDVRDYEPRRALISGPDGLDHYRALFQMLPFFAQHFLSTTFFLEMSPEQSGPLRVMISQNFPTVTTTLWQDLAGKDRLIQAVIKP